MARGLGSTITTELAKDQLRIADLVELHFDTPSRLTNAPFAITTTTGSLGSGTYSANGELLTFDLVSETIDARVNQIKVVLTGATSTFTDLFLNDDYVDRRVVIYRIFFDENFNQVGSPVMLWDGEIVGYQISETLKNSTVSVTSSSVFYDFELQQGRRTNDISQQSFFPGDRGMEFSTGELSDIKWGRNL